MADTSEQNLFDSGSSGPTSARMKTDWDQRARENARWFINTLSVGQTEEEFDLTGRRDFDGLVMADLPLLTDGRDPCSLRLLEIGCGIGRMSRYLAEVFGQVEAIDVSGEMVSRARERLRGMANLSFHESNGVDLSLFDDESFDTVFCAYVFQHIPDEGVIESYIREAFRVLRPRGIFKFVTNAVADAEYLALEKNTWSGAIFPEARIRTLARELGAQITGVVGDGTQYCWTMLRKRQASVTRPAIEPGVDRGDRSPRIVTIGRAENLEQTELAPRTDIFYIGLIVEGISAEEVDADSLVIVIGEIRLVPCYAGPCGTMSIGPERRRESIQINVRIPADLPAGESEIRVEKVTGEEVASARLTLPVLVSSAPRVVAVTNGLDGGLDIEHRGPKSGLRILVADLPATIDITDAAISFNNGPWHHPEGVRYLAGNGLWELSLEGEGLLEPGALGVVVSVRGLVSERVDSVVH